MGNESDAGQHNSGAGAGDGSTSSFLDSMSEGMRGNALFEGVESADSLGQKLIDMNTGMEELKSQQPKGAPDDIKDYMFDVPEGITINEDESNAFKQLAKENGLNNDVYQAVMKFETDRILAAGKVEADKHAESITALKKEFGDKLDEALTAADSVLQKSPFAKDMFNSTDPVEMKKQLGDSPLLFRVFHWVSTAISPDSLESGGQGVTGDSRQKNEAGKSMLKYGSEMDNL